MIFGVRMILIVNLILTSTSALAWVRAGYGVDLDGGSVTSSSKVANESDKTGTFVGCGLVGRWEYLDAGEVGFGVGVANYDLDGRSKTKKFQQKYAATVGYARLRYLLPIEGDSGVWFGPEIAGRYGQGAGFDYAMRTQAIGTMGFVLNVRIDDGWGWNPGLDLRVGYDLESKERSVSFFSAGLSIVK